jgi:hypothetical protein
MEFTFTRTTKIVAAVLLASAATQIIYTALYLSGADVPRQFLWGLEGFLFTVLAAFAGSAMLQAKWAHLGWAAIGFAALLNVVQVGVGLTLFGPFFEAAGTVEGLEPVAGAIVAYSFMVYNAAKVLLALAAVVFGLLLKGAGAKALGGLTALVGVVAFVANALSLGMGRDFLGEIPLAGGSGVLATILLAVCLLKLPADSAAAD